MIFQVYSYDGEKPAEFISNANGRSISHAVKKQMARNAVSIRVPPTWTAARRNLQRTRRTTLLSAALHGVTQPRNYGVTMPSWLKQLDFALLVLFLLSVSVYLAMTGFTIGSIVMGYAILRIYHHWRIE